MAAFLVQILNGLQLSMLLFLLAVGLSVVFGLMRFMNLAHGTLYMLGAYLALTLTGWGGSFWLAMALAPPLTAALGGAAYLLLLRRLQDADPTRQVLLTFGLIYVGLDTVRAIWGSYAHALEPPVLLAGQVLVLGEVYPAYRLFVIALGVAVMAALYLTLERSRLGAMVRAAVDDRESAECLGVDTGRLFLGVFCLGCGLAGLAGVAAAPVLSIYPGMDMAVLILALIVVVIGGPGSLAGAAIGSVLIGMADTFGRVLLPELAMVAIYAVMAAALLWRPQGLFARA